MGILLEMVAPLGFEPRIQQSKCCVLTNYTKEPFWSFWLESNQRLRLIGSGLNHSATEGFGGDSR